jgi:CheY-like chemotaxis protein
MAVRGADREAQVLAADDEQTLQDLLKQGVDLILFNRVIDGGFDEPDGVGIIRRLRKQHPGVKMMLVSNYPEAQAAAVAAGALPGFGKADIGTAKARTALEAGLT